MIASRLGLVIASAIALVLALVLALDVMRDAPAIDRALVPGFDPAHVTALRWRRTCSPPAQGCVPVVEVRKGTAGWRWASDGAPVERTALDAVLSALRGATWQRAADGPASAGVEVEVARGARTTKLVLGPPLPGGAQAWITRDGQRLLVDDWVIRALAPEPLVLRMRHPFADAASATRIVIEHAQAIRLEGSPRRLVKPAPFLLAPSPVKALELALAELEIVALRADTAPLGDRRWTITIDAPLLVTVDIGGPCGAPDQLAIAGTVGQGCVAKPAVDAIDRALATVIDPARALELRPLPIEPVRVTLPDGTVVDLEKRARVGDRDADPVRVAELVSALATPAERVDRPATTPTGKLVVEDRAGVKHELELFADRVVARPGEANALRVPAAQDAALRRPATALADTTLWTEEPTTISAIAIDGTTYTRGAVLGEWSRSGPGADLPGVVEQLAGLLARPRSLGTHAVAQPSRELAITVTPPSGAPRTHALALVVLPQGCGAIVDGARHLLAPELCALVRRLR